MTMRNMNKIQVLVLAVNIDSESKFWKKDLKETAISNVYKR